MSEHTITMFEDKIYWRNILQAAEHNDLDAVKYFVEEQHVKLVNVTNANAQTAAHLAAQKCNMVILKYLLDNKPELTKTKDIFGHTLLHMAIDCGLLDMVKYLVVERGMNIYEPANVHLGDNSVQRAVEKGWLHILKYFVEDKHVDVNLKNRMGQPIAFPAALNRHVHIIRYLLEECNADLFITDDNKDNILHISSRIGDLRIPTYLLDEKKLNFDIEWKDRWGGNILHQAARLNHLVFIKYFVGEKGANFNAQDYAGRTPLHEASMEGHLQVVQYLMDQGASVAIQDNYGKTPLQVTNDKHVIQYLKNYLPSRKRRSVRFGLLDHYGREVSESPLCGQIEGTQVGSIQERNLSQLHSFLTLAHFLLKHRRSQRVGLQGDMHESLFSPQETMENRVDPLALDAISSVSAFEES